MALRELAEYRAPLMHGEAGGRYPQSVERDIVREIGAMYVPYTGTCFASTRETDLGHIVPVSEPHDCWHCSGLGQPPRSALLGRLKNGVRMPTLDEVYRKFGEVSEAAQLLETELGTMLLTHKCVDAGLLERPNSEKAAAIHDHVTKQTLGKPIRSLGPIGGISENLERRLSTALATRNRLTHTFYLQHNFRRNSDDGREVLAAA